MEEVIEQLVELIKKYKRNDEFSNSQPIEEDAKNMLTILKTILNIKNQELSAYNMLLCHAAHSFKDEEIKLVDTLRIICKDDINGLENLRSAIKSITY